MYSLAFDGISTLAYLSSEYGKKLVLPNADENNPFLSLGKELSSITGFIAKGDNKLFLI